MNETEKKLFRSKPWRIGTINRASQSDGRLHTDADTLVSDAERFLRQRTGTKDGGHRIGHIPPASCALDCPVSAITQGRENVIYSLQDEHIRWILEETYAHISER